MSLKKVMVVVDHEYENQPAVDRALTIAGLTEVEVKLFSCDYTQYLVEGFYFDAVDMPRLRREYLEERSAALEALAKPMRDKGVHVTVKASWDHPEHAAIIRAAIDYGADLVIAPARKHGAIERMLLSNNDWQLVRCCPLPLLLVKNGTWQARPVVVSAVDPLHSRDKPTGLDHKLISYANDFATLMGADHHVFHSYAQIPLSGTYFDEARDEHAQAFDQLIKDFDIPEDHRHLDDESVDYGLSQLEHQLGTDVIVMGAISRSFLSDVFIGNTAERVIDNVDCDILVVKPDGYVSPIA